MAEPAARLRVFLIRHAETGQNRAGIVQGRADNALSELGLRQARALGERLAGERIDAIYSSPLARARLTAEAVAAPHALTVAAVPELVEMDIGEMEGLTGAEMRERHPEFLKAWMSEHAGTALMPGGESLSHVQERAGAALDRIVAAHLSGGLAVVSHNFVVLTLICRVLDLPLHQFRRLRHHVAGTSIIDVTAGRPRLVCLNDVCHLEQAGLLGDDPWQPRSPTANSGGAR